jgi:hypothetical protein
MILTYGGSDVSNDIKNNLQIDLETNEVLDDSIQNVNSDLKS